MDQTAPPFVITISRQLGSGGAYIGQQLATTLGIRYVDRVIIHEAAERLSLLQEDAEAIEEQRLSFWQSLLEGCFVFPGLYIPPQQILAPRDRALFTIESDIIRRIAAEGPAVIIGRCAFHILRDHPQRISIFLHGEPSRRISRVQELYKGNPEETAQRVAQSDRKRDEYCMSFTGADRTDARNYDLAIDTSRTDLDAALALILQFLEHRKSR